MHHRFNSGNPYYTLTVIQTIKGELSGVVGRTSATANVIVSLKLRCSSSTLAHILIRSDFSDSDSRSFGSPNTVKVVGTFCIVLVSDVSIDPAFGAKACVSFKVLNTSSNSSSHSIKEACGMAVLLAPFVLFLYQLAHF